MIETNGDEYFYLIGIEREGLRCDASGSLCASPHPPEFGDRMKNRFITTDFGEEQIELRTPPCASPQKCYDKLLVITRSVLEQLEIRGEYIWPYSMPCTLPAEKDFIYNDYTGYPDEEKYEKYLAEKYGFRRLSISGVHFNFSVTQKTIDKLRVLYPEIPSDADEAYLRCIRGIYRAMYTFSFFFDASPTDLCGNTVKTNSFRNSVNGYNNGLLGRVDVSSKEKYFASVQELLDKGHISRTGELYIPVRAREAVNSSTSSLYALRNAHIDHIELRMFDVDPFDICGISRDSISLATAFVFCCFVWGEAVPEDKKSFISECGKINDTLCLGLSDTLMSAENTLKTGDTISRRIRERIADHSFDLMGLAVSYSLTAVNDAEIIPGFDRLESATKKLIQDAVMLGIDYRVIDEKRSIVEFAGYKANEVIVQATRTSRDSCIFEYVTDDKLYARELFAAAGIRVPKTISLTRAQIENGSFSVSALVNRPSVIKPKSANYGDGITIFEDVPKGSDMEYALRRTLEYDDTVLIEELVCGEEYRFFLIGGRVRSVVKRIPANVIGDGVHTVKELIAIKEATRRFKRWEKTIIVNETTHRMLKALGMDSDTVPDNGKQIYLQKVSNASLGGETADVTDEIPQRFKKAAEKAAELFHAFICGVDIIIPDITGDEYALLEINDNPGLLISEVPGIGKERRLGQEIFAELGLGM